MPVIAPSARRAFVRVLAAAGVFCACSLSVKRAQANDSWWGHDKALHFGVSTGLALGGYGLGALLWEDPEYRLASGAAVALSAGIAKELWDLAGHGNPSFKDLAWDGIGTSVGLGLALTVDIGLLGNRNWGAPARRSVALAIAW